MPRINNQMRYLLSQKENDLEGIKPYIQDVHDMVRELCKELGTAPIEDIVAWHQDTTPYRSLIKLFINYIKHCRIKFHKGEYFNWEAVLASMWQRPNEVWFPCSTLCEDCGKWTVAAYVYSPIRTWMNLGGRGGMMLFCPRCKKQIEYKLLAMN